MFACGKGVFCPRGSATPIPVREGFYTITNSSSFVGNTRMTNKREHECEAGFWCQEGIRYPCEAGRFGDKVGEIDKSCSGLCEAGHWCDLGSTNPRENKCTNPSYRCPEGSATQLQVSAGFYSNEETLKVMQHACPPGHWCSNGFKYKCPAGTYGKHQKLKNERCDGLCLPGFYCPAGSDSNRKVACGNRTVHCPIGSSLPVRVKDGWYSYNSSSLVDYNELKLANKTMSWQRICEPGHYCVNGEKFECPGGTWGNLSGMRSESDCKACYAGHVCPPKSTEPTVNPCGDVNLYCPPKSARPLTVEMGYYSVNDEDPLDLLLEVDNREHYRTAQRICPPGTYCVNGRTLPCPAGTFGRTAGLPNQLCSGFCPAGFYCKEGTAEPKECDINMYSTPGASVCISCNSPIPYGHKRCKTSRSCCTNLDGVIH